MMYTIYTDGSCCVKTGFGGFAVVVEGKDEWGGYRKNTTSQRMEIIAVMQALEWCKIHNATATIYSDSQYVVKGLNEWAKKWQLDNWKKCIKNKDLWVDLYPMYLESGCKVVKVKAHSGVDGNERADHIANEYRKLLTEK